MIGCVLVTKSSWSTALATCAVAVIRDGYRIISAVTSVVDQCARRAISIVLAAIQDIGVPLRSVLADSCEKFNLRCHDLRPLLWFSVCFPLLNEAFIARSLTKVKL